MLEDELIIKLLFERNESAIEELSKKYGKLCKYLSYNILKNEEDAKECVNDTFHAVWKTIPPQKPEQLKTYVCKIARNISLKRYRTNTAKKRNGYYDMVLDEVAECFESSNTIEDNIMAEELAEKVNEFLRGLKVKDRVIFVQRYWYCCTIEEISDKMGMSVNYVTVKLYRIRTKLKKYLRQEGYL